MRLFFPRATASEFFPLHLPFRIRIHLRMDSFAEADDEGIGTTDDHFDDEPIDNEFDANLIETAQQEQDEQADSRKNSGERSDSDDDEDEDEKSSNFTNESAGSDWQTQMESYPKATRGRGRGVVPSTPPPRGRGRGRANISAIDDETEDVVPQVC